LGPPPPRARSACPTLGLLPRAARLTCSSAARFCLGGGAPRVLLGSELRLDRGTPCLLLRQLLGLLGGALGFLLGDAPGFLGGASSLVLGGTLCFLGGTRRLRRCRALRLLGCAPGLFLCCCAAGPLLGCPSYLFGCQPRRGRLRFLRLLLGDALSQRFRLVLVDHVALDEPAPIFREPLNLGLGPSLPAFTPSREVSQERRAGKEATGGFADFRSPVPCRSAGLATGTWPATVVARPALPVHPPIRSGEPAATRRRRRAPVSLERRSHRRSRCVALTCRDRAVSAR
jgi:hypothetical protein